MLLLIFQCRCDEVGKQWVRCIWLGLEFRVELRSNKEGVFWEFDDFCKETVRTRAREEQSGAFQAIAVFGIEFVTMSMPLADFGLPISLGGSRARLQHAGVSA